MWTFNIARELVRRSGRVLLPTNALIHESEHEQAGRAGALRDDDSVTVVKVHQSIKPDTPHSLYVVTRRDARDAMISYMRFMGRRELEAGLQFLRAAVTQDAHFMAIPTELRLTVDYPDIVQTPARVVGAIAERLGIETTADDLSSIADKYSKSAVAEGIAKQDAEVVAQLERGDTPTDGTVVPVGQGRFRAFDPTTGFQTGHVSNYRDGDWKTILTAAQKQQVEDTIREAKAALGTGGAQ
jgi:hypothetical protein